MNNLASNTLLSRLEYKQLKQKIRHAEEPNNPNLLRLFINVELATDRLCLANYRLHLQEKFRLLIDTLADDHLPAHWRGLCLNSIYRPLYMLQHISDCEQSKHQANLLSHELRTISHYYQAGITSN